ncbi:uncharacterized protein LOC117176517 [Belonocnema kinseyi]|uniref:uncharacterized protein LOC117176517 n=1 Tax=Belonocnema kinseyi TaxID=2817044 RepID=UPI00143CECCB|nr:uncharacterized protein LOC117176517 [Belonocnema kinseyi]
MKRKVTFAFLLITIAVFFLETFVDAGIVGWTKCKANCRDDDVANPVCINNKGHFKSIGWKKYKCYEKYCKSAVKNARHGACPIRHKTHPNNSPTTASHNPGSQNSVSQNPGSQNSVSQNPGSQNAVSQYPGSQNSVSQNPASMH